MNKIKNKLLLLFAIMLLISNVLVSQTFKKQQLKNKRVKTSYKEKESEIKSLFKSKGFETLKLNIFLRAFKESDELELWAKSVDSTKYKYIKTYKICLKSGKLGPKRVESDMQVPEGFYHIKDFNPQSNYYLSLGINYPNKSDLFFADKKRPGGAIYIHGSCLTIGCIPLTDNYIKELYVICVEAYSNGQKQIPVHIFPFKMSKQLFEFYSFKNKNETSLINFWTNIQEGYNYFEKTNTIPKISVDKNGLYLFE